MSKQLPPRARAFIESFVPEAMQDSKTPAFSLAVVADGKTIYEEGFGLRDRALHLPATANTLYGIGSCTKAFVATAVLQLAEKGKLSLSDPISRYVPFKLGAKGPNRTIHHFLTHSSGLPSLSTSTVLLSKGLGADTGIPMGGVDDFYRFLNGAEGEIADAPGERFFYNNAGYRMLGHVIQTVSGMPFHEYVTKNVVRPLGMERATFVRSEFEADADRIVPHWVKPDGTIVPTDFPYPDVGLIPEFSFVASAGGLIAPMSEMTRFLTANMGNGKELGLTPASLKKLHTLHIDRPTGLYGHTGYGYGWMVTDDFLGGTMVHHSGSIEVSTAMMAFLPGRNFGVAMAANCAGMPHAAIAEGILAALCGKDPQEAVPSLAIKSRMKALCGEYELYRGVGRVRVVSKAGLLYLEQKDVFTDSLLPLIPEDDRMETGRFYTLTEGVRQPVAIVAGKGRTDLFIERYRYRKIG